MKHLLLGILTCVSLIFSMPPAHAETNNAPTDEEQNLELQNLPFTLNPSNDFHKQTVEISGISVWANPNKCVLTLLTGKSNVEGYLLNKIYSNKNNLDAYYLKLSKHDGLKPQTITKEEKVKLKDGKEITVYESNQTIQKQKFVFWDAFYQNDDTYATLLLQCTSPGMNDNQALAIFSSVKPQTVTPLADDIKALPFKVTISQPYYVSYTSRTPPQYASVAIKQAIEQINQWPETEIFINYDAGPYANLTEFINKSPIAEQFQIKERSKKQNITKNVAQNNDDANNKVYIFDEEDGKNSSVIYLKRSYKGEVIVTTAITNTDKISLYRPIIDKINDSIEFLNTK